MRLYLLGQKVFAVDTGTGRVLEKVSPCVSLGYQTAAIFLPDIWDQNVRMYFIKQIRVMFKNKKI